MTHVVDPRPAVTAPSPQRLGAPPAPLAIELPRLAAPADAPDRADEARRASRLKLQQLALASGVAEKAAASRLVRSAASGGARPGASQASQQAWAASTRSLVEIASGADDEPVTAASDVYDDGYADAGLDTDDTDDATLGSRSPDVMRRLAIARGAAERRPAPSPPPKPPPREREARKGRAVEFEIDGEDNARTGHDAAPAAEPSDDAAWVAGAAGIERARDRASIHQPIGLHRIEPLQDVGAAVRRVAPPGSSAARVVAWASAVLVATAAVAAIVLTFAEGSASSSSADEERPAPKSRPAPEAPDAVAR
jgi:hypothetical protein